MNPENYYFQVPLFPQITDNPRTETVGINNSNPQYDLDVRGTVHACNLLSYTANLTDIDTSLIVASNVLASNVIALSAYASNLDVTNFSLQETPIGSTASNPLIDYSFLKDHGLSNEVWIEHWKKFCGLGGSLVGGVYAYTASLAVWDDPLLSPHGITAFDAAEAVAGVNGAEGYAYALETLNPLGQFFSSVQAAHLGKFTGEQSFSSTILNTEDTALSNAGFQTIDIPFTILGCNLDIPITSDFDINTLNELTCVDEGAGAALASMDTDAYLPIQGWITKVTPLMQGLGTLAGTAFGCKVQVALNTTTLEDHTAQLETLTSDVTTLTTDVTALDELTATHTADIAALDTTVTGLTADVTALDTSVAAIEIELTSTTNTANAAQTTALWDSNNFANYLPLSGGTMSGILTAYSNIVMNSPMMLTGSNSTTAANLLIDPAFMRYVNSNGIQFSVNSNGLFPLSTPFIRILGNTEVQSSYSNFSRIDCSWVNGFTVGCGLCNNAPNGFEWFNVGSNSSISTFAHDIGTMNQIVNSNSEIYFGGALLKKDSSITDLNGYTLVDNTGTLRRKGSNITGATGFSVSPSGYVSAGTGLTIDPYGNLVCSNITTSNLICASNLSASNIFISGSNTNTLYSLSNTQSNFMRNSGGYFTGNVAFGSNTYSAVSQDVLHVFVPAIGGYSSNDFAITSGWGGYYDVCGIAWNSYNIANNYYCRYNNTKLGWSLLTSSGGGSLNFSCYGAGYTGSNIPQGVSFTPLQINSNFVNISSISEGGVLIATKYLLSNVASNYVLTATANSVYAQSNMMSNYSLSSSLVTFSNFCNSNYVLSNSQSNFVTTLFGNTNYSPSNQLSNYHLLSAFNTYSNYAGSNFYTISNQTTFSNWSVSNYLWSSNTFSNYHLVSAFNTYSNWATSNYLWNSNTMSNYTALTLYNNLSNFAYGISNSGTIVYSNISASAGTIGSLVMSSTGLALGGYNLLNNSGQLTSPLTNAASTVTIDPTAGAVSALTGKFNYARFGTTSISLSNDLLIYTTGSNSNMSMSSNSLSVLNAINSFTFNASNVIFTSNLSASNIYLSGSNLNTIYSLSNAQSNYVLTTTATTIYAPSNVLSNYAPSNLLSNYVLTNTANTAYAPSNQLSNYHLVSAFNTYSNYANSQYAPSNVLSNYTLTNTANTAYAPSNQLSNYHLVSAFNTYSNYANSQYAPSNVLSNYAINSTSNNAYAPSNVLSNYVLISTANTAYAPSNVLSNYETTSAFTTFSNWISPLAGTGSNAGSGVIGTATIGNCGCNNYASFSYCNMNNSNNCAILQDSLGNTTISCSSNPSVYLYTNVSIKQGQTNLAQFNTTSNYFFTPTSFCAPVNFSYSWNSNNPICLDLALDNYSSLRIGATSFINPYGQIILGAGVNYQHNIATRHASIDTTGTGNAIDFLIWSCNLAATATATYCSMSVTACNVGINNKTPNIAYKLDVNGGVNINSNLNVVGNTNSFGSLFAGKNTGSAAVAGGGYIVTGNGFDGAATTHTINPFVSGSADNSSGICVVTAKNSSISSPMNGVMVLSWVKAAGSAQLQPSIINVNQSGMSVFTASNNGANSITVYTPASCSVTYTTMGGC